MRTLRVGGRFYVSASEVVLVQGFPSRPSRREKARAEAANCFYEASLTASKRGRTRSLVTLKNGWVVASPSRPETLVNRLVQVPPDSPSEEVSACADAPEEAEPPRDEPEPQPEPQPNPRRSRNLFRRR